jgi:hypothetical protein
MENKQKPALGRQVRVRFRNEECTATICKVWDDSCVNLSVIDPNGQQHPYTSVILAASDEQKTVEGRWWWPEYNK